MSWIYGYGQTKSWSARERRAVDRQWPHRGPRRQILQRHTQRQRVTGDTGQHVAGVVHLLGLVGDALPAQHHPPTNKAINAGLRQVSTSIGASAAQGFPVAHLPGQHLANLRLAEVAHGRLMVNDKRQTIARQQVLAGLRVRNSPGTGWQPWRCRWLRLTAAMPAIEPPASTCTSSPVCWLKRCANWPPGLDRARRQSAGRWWRGRRRAAERC